MIPIHELLNRIRWDESFGAAVFELGYYDRVEGDILRVPFKEVRFEPGDHFAFQVADQEGAIHTVPLHRVKAVWRNGELIWHREH
jgi:Uncharacterized protein conserved in archaea